MRLSELIIPFEFKMECLLDQSYYSEDDEYIDYHAIDNEAKRYGMAIAYLKQRRYR